LSLENYVDNDNNNELLWNVSCYGTEKNHYACIVRVDYCKDDAKSRVSWDRNSL
jgi:hypothetical protein